MRINLLFGADCGDSEEVPGLELRKSFTVIIFGGPAGETQSAQSQLYVGGGGVGVSKYYALGGSELCFSSFMHKPFRQWTSNVAF